MSYCRVCVWIYCDILSTCTPESALNYSSYIAHTKTHTNHTHLYPKFLSLTFLSSVIIIESFYSARNWVYRLGVTWLWWTTENWVFCPRGHAVRWWSEIISKQEQNSVHTLWRFGIQSDLSEEPKWTGQDETRWNMCWEKENFIRSYCYSGEIKWEHEQIRDKWKWEEEKEEISNNLADLVGMKHYEVLVQGFLSAIPHIRFFFSERYHGGNRHISLSTVCF